MAAKAIRIGQEFRFTDDPQIYEFVDFVFNNGEPIVFYKDGLTTKQRSGFYIIELITE